LLTCTYSSFIPLIMYLSYAMTNVFFKSISNQVIGILKGNWSLRRRQRLPLRNTSFAVTPSNSPFLGEKSMSIKKGTLSLGEKERSPKAKGPDFVFGIILTHLFMTKGEDSSSRALMIPFLAIHAKGGESKSPKQKDRTNFKNFQKLSIEYSSIGILLCSKRGRK
jgi:hypothetical protein